MTTTVINSELVAWAQAETVKGTKFHAVLCDPPYGLDFMGSDWDKNAQFKQWGESLLPLLYPGAIVLMFGGTRTWPRLAAGMEDAGFEMWDTLMWLYGSGFPKAHDISLSIDKSKGHANRGKAIPVASTHFPNGKYAPEGEKLTGNKVEPYKAKENEAKNWSGYKTPALKPAWEPILCLRASRNGLTYAGCALQYGSACLNIERGRVGERYPANLILDEEAVEMLGSPSRFFYCAKASKKERGEGNNHPTVKPIDLCRYLATLILPPPSVPNRSILVP